MTDHATHQNTVATPLAPALGVELSGLSLTRLTDRDVKAIWQALDDHGCVLIRGQQLSAEGIIAAARRLGMPYVPPKETLAKVSADIAGLYIVSNIKDGDGKAIGGLGAGEAMWHADLSHLEKPPEASLLHAVEVPDEGGDTWVCSLTAALETMPAGLHERLEGRRIKHDGIYTAGGALRPGVDPGASPMESEGTFHPAICVHPRTGRPFLFPGRRINAYVEGLPLEESEALLDELWEHMTRPEHVYKHRWMVGDVLMWDNHATMHRRDAFDPNARRHMNHVRLAGRSAPVAA